MRDTTIKEVELQHFELSNVVSGQKFKNLITGKLVVVHMHQLF
jgi:hypothetical protein